VAVHLPPPLPGCAKVRQGINPAHHGSFLNVLLLPSCSAGTRWETRSWRGMPPTSTPPWVCHKLA
jgi:hypothetical protein